MKEKFALLLPARVMKKSSYQNFFIIIIVEIDQIAWEDIAKDALSVSKKEIFINLDFME